MNDKASERQFHFHLEAQGMKTSPKKSGHKTQGTGTVLAMEMEQPRSKVKDKDDVLGGA